MSDDKEPSSSSNYKSDDGDDWSPFVKVGDECFVARDVFLGTVDQPYENRELSRTPIRRPCRPKSTLFNSVLTREISKKIEDEKRLRAAALFNDTEEVSRLLKKGVNPNCNDSHKRSPLHLASCKGYTEVVKLLLDHGANPNIQDSLGNVPLHLAACTDHIGVINLLLKAGANALSSDKMGRSPLQLAQSKLEILKRSEKSEAELKLQVDQIIQMLLLSLKNDGCLKHHILSRCNEVVQKCESRGEIDTQLNNLLDSLNTWRINE